MASDDLKVRAFRILAARAPAGADQAALLSSFGAAVEGLQGELAPLLGALAVKMLFTRAVRLAAGRYPYLDGLTIYEEGIEAGDLLALKPQPDAREMCAALGEVIAVFLGLLAELLGKDLAVRLVSELRGDEAAGGTG